MEHKKLTVEDLNHLYDEVIKEQKLGVETFHTTWGTIYRIHLGNGGFVDTGEGGLKEFNKAMMRNLQQTTNNIN